MPRGCDFFHMSRVFFRKLKIPSDFNICVSCFLCLRAGYGGGNDLVMQCLRLGTYCLEHVVQEQFKENASVQNNMGHDSTLTLLKQAQLIQRRNVPTW